MSRDNSYSLADMVRKSVHKRRGHCRQQRERTCSTSSLSFACCSHACAQHEDTGNRFMEVKRWLCSCQSCGCAPPQDAPVAPAKRVSCSSFVAQKRSASKHARTFSFSTEETADATSPLASACSHRGKQCGEDWQCRHRRGINDTHTKHIARGHTCLAFISNTSAESPMGAAWTCINGQSLDLTKLRRARIACIRANHCGSP
jgi:hypothetical protein